jgi:hypothetical protein
VDALWTSLRAAIIVKITVEEDSVTGTKLRAECQSLVAHSKLRNLDACHRIRV